MLQMVGENVSGHAPMSPALGVQAGHNICPSAVYLGKVQRRRRWGGGRSEEPVGVAAQIESLELGDRHLRALLLSPTLARQQLVSDSQLFC